MKFSTTAFVLLPFLQHALTSTVTYTFDFTWVTANPDGQLARPVIGVNGNWPLPTISCAVGDQVVVYVNNKLGNESTGLHFHGLKQYRPPLPTLLYTEQEGLTFSRHGTSGYDGPPGVVQCPIPPGSSFQYSFTVEQPGTYWYHSHAAGQYPDGLRAPFIVSDPQNPYSGQYDTELVLSMSDWYHDQMPGLLARYADPTQNPTGAEPIPYSALLNDAQSISLNVQPGKTYFLRTVNMAAFSQFYLHFDQHQLTIIEIDGVYTKPKTVDSLYIANGQRYGVLLKTKPTASQNYAFLGSMDTTKYDRVPGYLKENVTGNLVYSKTAPRAEMPVISAFNVIDDFTLVPYDGMALLSGAPNAQIVLNADFFLRDGQNRAGFNNVTYVPQKVPLLFTVFSAPAGLVQNPAIYGVNSNAFVVKQGDVVEVVINNYDAGSHPFHIHGHDVQLVARQPGVYNPPPHLKHPDQPNKSGHNGSANALGYTGNTATMPAVPMRRDTWLIAPNGYTVIRFTADNPGVWFLHCHMDWHVEVGLAMTLVEAPQQLQQQQSINPAMASICKAQGIPTTGNAAGNTQNWLDLSNANTVASAQRGALYP
ncbi:hypothetical protein B0A49_07323 [Cryomyces minteri]|uniref:Multicopper oxidase n=1 Tax=Cryomyces minteri TaxID=331657 RepID=A0A4U0XBK1_9PEZI|nr:hypothetical protein B0A49_07323 [Cryomyces minteri]